VPVPADGSRTELYVGPKDHYVLKRASQEIGAEVGRQNLDLEGLINYGYGGSISRPIAERLLWCIKKLYQLVQEQETPVAELVEYLRDIALTPAEALELRGGPIDR
jgi:hypothetical protein